MRKINWRIFDNFFSNIFKIFISIPLVFLLIVITLPYLSLFISNFHLSQQTLVNLIINDFKLYFSPSFIILTSVSLLTLIIGLGLAWLTAFYEFPQVKIFKILLVFPLAIPAYINGMVYADITENNLASFFADLSIKNIYGVIFILTISLYPYVYLLLYSKFKKLGDLVSISRLSGKKEWEIFSKVILPNTKWTIIAAMLLVAVESLTEFGIVKFYNVNSFVSGIYNNWFFWGNYQNAALLSIILMFIVLFFSYVQKKSAKRDNNFIINGSTVLVKETKLGKWKASAASLFCLIIILLCFIIPLLHAIFVVLFNKQALIDHELFKAFLNSITISFFGASVIIIISVILVWFTTIVKRSGNFNILLKFFANSHLIPGPVIAVAILTISYLFGAENDFFDLFLYSPMLLLLYAYISRFIAIGYRNINRSLQQIPDEINLIIACSSKDIFTKVKKIILPMLSNSLIITYLLVIIEIVKELPATFFIRPSEFETLATRTFDYAMVGETSLAMPSALAIIIVNIFALFFLSRNITHKNELRWEI